MRVQFQHVVNGGIVTSLSSGKCWTKQWPSGGFNAYRYDSRKCKNVRARFGDCEMVEVERRWHVMAGYLHLYDAPKPAPQPVAAASPRCGEDEERSSSSAPKSWDQL